VVMHVGADLVGFLKVTNAVFMGRKGSGIEGN
jgi:hypothetical protein